MSNYDIAYAMDISEGQAILDKLRADKIPVSNGSVEWFLVQRIIKEAFANLDKAAAKAAGKLKGK